MMVSNGASVSERMRTASAGQRVTVAMLAGAAAGAGGSLVTVPSAADPPGGIDFNEAEPPTYTDFAYFAFTVGMTFQVADTNITSKAVRRITLHHALLSYLFGAVLLGLVINVVSTLLK